MFGRDPIVPLNSLLKAMVRYLGTYENILPSEASKNVYQLVATNLQLARKKWDTKTPVPNFKLNRVTKFYLGIILLMCGT